MCAGPTWPHACMRWPCEGDLPAAAEPDRAIPESAATAPGAREPARAARSEASRDRIDPGGARQGLDGDAGLQEHRHAPRAPGRPGRSEEGARRAQGDAHDPREVAPEAREVPLRTLQRPRGQDPDGPGRGRRIRRRLNFSPYEEVANPYIARSVGESVDEDSGSEESPEPDESPDESTTEPTGTTPPGPVLNRMSFSRFLMIFLFLLALYALIDPQVGLGFAGIANFAFAPLIGFGGTLPVLTILLAGMLTTTLSSILRDHYTNWVKMARTQKIMAAWRKEQMEAIRKGQQTKLEKLKEAQQGFLKDSMEVQMAPMKSTAWTMFMFIVVFTWLRLFVDVTLGHLGNQWIAVPWSTHVFLNAANVFPNWVLLYSLLAIPFGQIVIRLLKYVRFKRRLDTMGVPLQPQPDEA